MVRRRGGWSKERRGHEMRTSSTTTIRGKGTATEWDCPPRFPLNIRSKKLTKCTLLQSASRRPFDRESIAAAGRAPTFALGVYSVASTRHIPEPKLNPWWYLKIAVFLIHIKIAYNDRESMRSWTDQRGFVQLHDQDNDIYRI